jgi:hypothetical protein
MTPLAQAGASPPSIPASESSMHQGIENSIFVHSGLLRLSAEYSDFFEIFIIV